MKDFGIRVKSAAQTVLSAREAGQEADLAHEIACEFSPRILTATEMADAIQMAGEHGVE